MNVKNIWLSEEHAREVLIKHLGWKSVPPGIDALYTLKAEINKRQKKKNDDKFEDFLYVLFECPLEELPLLMHKEHLKEIIVWRLSNDPYKQNPTRKEKEIERQNKVGRGELRHVLSYPDVKIEPEATVKKSRY